MCAVTFGNLPNELASVSIAVETALPVTGHMIITTLMGDALRICSHLARKRWKFRTMTVLKTDSGPAGKF
jgi:hypothetical protein